ncbi:hypothetical protein B7P43_G13485 [Cryptotermes secundus]|uniref:Neurotransmitter-gated ion-channel ligand-binding domain-containing protein n=1 Tax=Cryptotermes secundus TaxID=105785 RepID=A0A2J7PCV1_9NEOP|nr:hypothetical protein B7P43_G13485 [Cryptotermes secundus]
MYRLTSVSGGSFELVRADDFKCPALTPTTTERRLRARYFSQDTLNRAVHRDNNTVDVKLRLVLRKFDFIVVNSRSLNREWKLASMKSYKNISKYDCCPNDTFSWVSFEFMLQRHPGGYSSTVVMPAVVLVLLTLLTFWMDPTEMDRLILATVDVVSHILFLQHLGHLLPANGDQTPLIIATARADDFQCPDNSTAITRLKSHVFCNYDPYIRPVRLYNETVDVRLRLVLKKIHFDEKRDTVHVYSLFGLIWTDYHLLWNPAEYENIEELRVSSYSLWTPDIGVYTSADETSFTPYMRPTICIVHSDGKVNCVPPSRHTASCSADLTRWPYDTHTCDLVLGSWTHTGEKVNISLMKPSIYLHDYNMNREWELVSMTSYRESGRFPCCPNDTYPAVIFQIVLQRHSGSYTAIVVAPAIVLILMTLVTWMKGDQSDRMIFAITDVFAHFLFLQYLGNILPPNGDSSPLIEEQPSTSTRAIARIVGTSKSSVWRILHGQQLYPYHPTRVHGVGPADFVPRVQFCQWLLNQCLHQPNFLNHVFFSDEAQFTRDGWFNCRNSHVWADENPNVTVVGYHQARFSVDVWACIIGDHLIGPFLLPPRLNGPFCKVVLERIIPTLLEDVPLIVRRQMWVQHDGAPAHFSIVSQDYLDGRWIGRGGPVPWPSRSPDLTPLDYFVWGHVEKPDLRYACR